VRRTGLRPRAGTARLLSLDELSADWNPVTDERVSEWEVAVRRSDATGQAVGSIEKWSGAELEANSPDVGNMATGVLAVATGLCQLGQGQQCSRAFERHIGGDCQFKRMVQAGLCPLQIARSRGNFAEEAIDPDQRQWLTGVECRVARRLCQWKGSIGIGLGGRESCS
jgi:hypothetical protein